MTGVAVLNYAGEVLHTEQHRFRDEPHARPIAFRDFLDFLIGPWGKIDAVVFEMPFAASYAATASHHELIAALRICCHDRQVPYFWVNTSTLRKSMGIAGRKSVDVKAAIAEWYRRGGERPEVSQDEMDATLVGCWYLMARGMME